MDKHRNPDGTYNGAAVLSDLSGIPQDGVREIFEQVKANHAKLNACAYHEFDPIEGSRPTRRRYRCRHCGGEIDSIAFHWHEQGRRPR